MILSIAAGSRNLPTELTVAPGGKPFAGGEGDGYVTSDGKYFAKIYRRFTTPDERLQKQTLLQHVVDLGFNLGEDEQFLAWPRGIVTGVDRRPAIGVVTCRIPPECVQLYRLIWSWRDAQKQFAAGRNWSDYLKMARGVAAAVRTVHGKGIVHNDIHWKNFLANVATGEVTLIDLDGLVVKGFLPPQVAGIRFFMAPELILRTAQPGYFTDRHSLAALVLWTLLFRDVMKPNICRDEDPQRDIDLGYGQFAVFSEHPTVQDNWVPNITVPFLRSGVLTYKALTPKLQTLTLKALVEGLHNPELRPQAFEWERALAEMQDVLIRCSKCGQRFPYPYWVNPPPRRSCPFCGNREHLPPPVLLDLREPKAKGQVVSVRPMVLHQSMVLYDDVAEPGRFPPVARDKTPVLGQVSWNAPKSAHYLRNVSAAPWTLLAPHGGAVAPGESLALAAGLLWSFGNGKRMAQVVA